jgi:hypothetical protein
MIPKEISHTSLVLLDDFTWSLPLGDVGRDFSFTVNDTQRDFSYLSGAFREHNHNGK